MNHTYTQHPAFTKKMRSVRAEVLVCPICDNVRYEGVWYAGDSKAACLINKPTDIIGTLRCPACDMKVKGLYEGVLKVNNIPYELREEVRQIIFSAASNVTKYNPQDRLLELRETLDGYFVTTTKSSVAQKIGRVVNNEFGSYRIYSHYQQGPSHVYETSVVFI